MITEIGIVAGEIWHHLDQYGPAVFSTVLMGIDRPKDLALMSLGWLAREGHVIVRSQAGDLHVALRRSG